MGRVTSLPVIYDTLRSISMKDVTKWGLLKNKGFTKGQIAWSRDDYQTFTVNFELQSDFQNEFKLLYNVNGKEYSYNISIITLPSNLGKGKVPYFICPITGARCRKLRYYNGVFQHRSAIEGFYQWQVYSHKDRNLCKIYDQIKFSREAACLLTTRYFKKFYKGKATKRYKCSLYLIEKGMGYGSGTIERLMVGMSN